MYFKIFFLLFYLAETSAKSFTLVLDTTVTMQEELDTLKHHFRTMFSTSNLADVTNFILVPVIDPGVATPSISESPEGLLQSLNRVNVSGGHDCPENTLTGIQKALEVSSDESYIFVFTDAYANDERKLADIQDLCHTSRSQVVIFLSGWCKVKVEHSNVDVYYDVAKSCSGEVFRLEPDDLGQAFKFIKKLIEIQWSDITTHYSFSFLQLFNVTVDSSTTEMMLAVYGDTPTLQIVDENGITPAMEKVIETDHCLVVYLKELRNTNFQIRITCYDRTSMTMYKRFDVFRYGFSTHFPKSLRETALRPIPGRMNYIMIVLPETPNVKLNSIILFQIYENEQKSLTIIENHGNVYITSAFFKLSTTFRIQISGYDTSNNEYIQRSTKLLEPQRPAKEDPWVSPVVEIIDPGDINYGDSVTIACKVRGYPKPTINWKDSKGNDLPAEEVLLEMQSVHISYTRIDNLSSNLTVYCEAKNSQGEDTKDFGLYVYRELVFEVKQAPEDTKVEYGTEGRLYCEVEAYPEATIYWYHNDTRLTPSIKSIFSNDNIEINPELHALIIKNMSFEEAGEYKCEIKNEIQTKSFSAIVHITGLEPPSAEIEKSEITIKPGVWTDIECVVKGKPKPQVTWKFKHENEFTNVPDDVYFTDGKLKIPTAKMEYAGLYRCEAFNLLGKAYRDVIVTMKYEPTIRNVINELTVMEGDTVQLTCDVDALPPARVRWEMYQGDFIITLDERHTTDKDNTHRFEALWRDSGNYHCVAENEVGRAEKIAKINVLVAPYIQTPLSKSVTAKFGSRVMLSCNVLFGNPVPTTKWSFVALNSTKTVLSRGNSTSVLDLKNVTLDDVGTYVCLADNEVGSDTIRINLRVQ